MNIKKISAVIAALAVFLTAVSATVLAESKGVKISEKNFPDEFFREYVAACFDTDGNGYLSKEERKAVTEINIESEWEGYNFFKRANSLEGVEYFTELEKLYCNQCMMAYLDISKNTKLTHLYCDRSYLKSLDLSKNTKLEYLDCSGNKLSELDTSRNTRLAELNCAGNKDITVLDISKNTKLTRLICYTADLKKLDVSKNTQLKYISCENNSITSLNISSIPSLKNCTAAKTN